MLSPIQESCEGSSTMLLLLLLLLRSHPRGPAVVLGVSVGSLLLEGVGCARPRLGRRPTAGGGGSHKWRKGVSPAPLCCC
jgi:hypothetical protein